MKVICHMFRSNQLRFFHRIDNTWPRANVHLMISLTQGTCTACRKELNAIQVPYFNEIYLSHGVSIWNPAENHAWMNGLPLTVAALPVLMHPPCSQICSLIQWYLLLYVLNYLFKNYDLGIGSSYLGMLDIGTECMLKTLVDFDQKCILWCDRLVPWPDFPFQKVSIFQLSN